ncbi:hypothetical protein EST38_g12354 [Candolleomyces aberdarensis]|uniref:Uncharacterized protein n=1 Tax=Candolleomyces aberdarensis TaxID=2316362 RepID=A0A4Q2D2M5_9AGAR|nr:hypothetical protein EST38_g12354 [Candolleomyces aberdarensis]
MFPAYNSPFPPPKTRSELKTANTRSEDDVSPLLTSSLNNSSSSSFFLGEKREEEHEPFSSSMFFPRQRQSNASLSPDWDRNDTRSDLFSSSSSADDVDSQSVKTITSSAAFFHDGQSGSEIAASLGTSNTSLDLPFNSSMFFPRQRSSLESMNPGYDRSSRAFTLTPADDNDSELGLVDGVYIRPESSLGYPQSVSDQEDDEELELQEGSEVPPMTPTNVPDQAPVRPTALHAASMLQSSSPTPSFRSSADLSIYEMIAFRPSSAKVKFSENPSPEASRRRNGLYVPNSPTPGTSEGSSTSGIAESTAGGGLAKRWTSLRRLSLSSPKASANLHDRARSVSPGPNGTGSPNGKARAQQRPRGRSPAPTTARSTGRSPGQTQLNGNAQQSPTTQGEPSSPGRLRQALGTVAGSPSSLLRYTRSLRGTPIPKEPTSPLASYSFRGSTAEASPGKGLPKGVGLGIQNLAFPSSSITPSHSSFGGGSKLPNPKTTKRHVKGKKKADNERELHNDQETLLGHTNERSNSWTGGGADDDDIEGIDEATAEAARLVTDMWSRK